MKKYKKTFSKYENDSKPCKIFVNISFDPRNVFFLYLKMYLENVEIWKCCHVETPVKTSSALCRLFTLRASLYITGFDVIFQTWKNEISRRDAAPRASRFQAKLHRTNEFLISHEKYGQLQREKTTLSERDTRGIFPPHTMENRAQTYIKCLRVHLNIRMCVSVCV